jgi:outer membrane protein assembly factor BamB
VPGFRAPAVWTPERIRTSWSVKVGEGHASPVIAGGRVYVFAREGEQEILRCLNLADGREIWKDAYAAPYEMSLAARKHGKGPKATPVVAGNRVFALGIAGHFSAWDAVTGRVLWRKDFGGEFKTTSPEFGAAASPLVEGETVITHVGGKHGGALTAFDTATGATRWRWDGDGPGYASPVIATLGCALSRSHRPHISQ